MSIMSIKLGVGEGEMSSGARQTEAVRSGRENKTSILSKVIQIIMSKITMSNEIYL